MGRGHSGSTILDILLGNSEQIESVGELLSGLNPASRNKICSCGAAIPDCTFWREVRHRLRAEGIAWDEVSDIAEIGAAGLWRVWRAGNADPTLLARRVRITRALAGAITMEAGKPHLLDSSKTPAHGLLLLRHLPEARVIHLMRDPRHVLQSYVWRVRTGAHLYSRFLGLAGRSPSLYLAWMAASWTLVNLICDLMAWAFPGRVMRVRYEDLCAQPAREFDRIGRAFRVDLADLAGKVSGREPLVVGHNLGGNHLRHAGSVRFNPGSERPRPPLPRWLAIVCLLLCGPLMWRYGYRLGGWDPRAARSKAVAAS
jgi:hypothetical protein